MKRFYDRHAGQEIKYEEGDKVFLDGRNLKTDRPTTKMADKWLGPFEVLKKVGASAYKLKIPQGWKKVHPVFNVMMLKPAQEPAFASQRKPPPPPPIIIDDEEEYEVEEILDCRKRGRGYQYLVKWKDYTPDNNSWEPASNLENAPDHVSRFHQRYPSKPRPPGVGT